MARARVPRATSGGTRRARITKNASSMLKASDSPSRYTTTGHIQLPRTRAPIAAATIHWRSSTRTTPGCRHIATSKVRTPPATEAATTAPVARGILIADRARVSSMPSCSRRSRSRPTRPGRAGPAGLVPGPAGPVLAVPGCAVPVAVIPRPAVPGCAVPVVAVPRPAVPRRGYRTAPCAQDVPDHRLGFHVSAGPVGDSETVAPSRVGSSRAADCLRSIGPAVAAA